jgi:hypothetical protein
LKPRHFLGVMLVVSDGAPGVIRAIEECFPRSARQRCLAHRMRNLAVKVPTDLWPEFKTRVAACYQAPSRAIARAMCVSQDTFIHILADCKGSSLIRSCAGPPSTPWPRTVAMKDLVPLAPTQFSRRSRISKSGQA